MAIDNTRAAVSHGEVIRKNGELQVIKKGKGATTDDVLIPTSQDFAVLGNSIDPDSGLKFKELGRRLYDKYMHKQYTFGDTISDATQQINQQNMNDTFQTLMNRQQIINQLTGKEQQYKDPGETQFAANAYGGVVPRYAMGGRNRYYDSDFGDAWGIPLGAPLMWGLGGGGLAWFLSKLYSHYQRSGSLLDAFQNILPFSGVEVPQHPMGDLVGGGIARGKDILGNLFDRMRNWWKGEENVPSVRSKDIKADEPLRISGANYPPGHPNAGYPIIGSNYDYAPMDPETGLPAKGAKRLASPEHIHSLGFNKETGEYEYPGTSPSMFKEDALDAPVTFKKYKEDQDGLTDPVEVKRVTVPKVTHDGYHFEDDRKYKVGDKTINMTSPDNDYLKNYAHISDPAKSKVFLRYPERDAKGALVPGSKKVSFKLTHDEDLLRRLNAPYEARRARLANIVDKGGQLSSKALESLKKAPGADALNPLRALPKTHPDYQRDPVDTNYFYKSRFPTTGDYFPHTKTQTSQERHAAPLTPNVGIDRPLYPPADREGAEGNNPVRPGKWINKYRQNRYALDDEFQIPSNTPAYRKGLARNAEAFDLMRKSAIGKDDASTTSTASFGVLNRLPQISKPTEAHARLSRMPEKDFKELQKLYPNRYKNVIASGSSSELNKLLNIYYTHPDRGRFYDTAPNTGLEKQDTSYNVPASGLSPQASELYNKWRGEEYAKTKWNPTGAPVNAPYTPGRAFEPPQTMRMPTYYATNKSPDNPGMDNRLGESLSRHIQNDAQFNTPALSNALTRLNSLSVNDWNELHGAFPEAYHAAIQDLDSNHNPAQLNSLLDTYGSYQQNKVLDQSNLGKFYTQEEEPTTKHLYPPKDVDISGANKASYVQPKDIPGYDDPSVFARTRDYVLAKDLLGLNQSSYYSSPASPRPLIPPQSAKISRKPSAKQSSATFSGDDEPLIQQGGPIKPPVQQGIPNIPPLDLSGINNPPIQPQGGSDSGDAVEYITADPSRKYEEKPWDPQSVARINRHLNIYPTQLYYNSPQREMKNPEWVLAGDPEKNRQAYTYFDKLDTTFKPSTVLQRGTDLENLYENILATNNATDTQKATSLRDLIQNNATHDVLNAKIAELAQDQGKVGDYAELARQQLSNADLNAQANALTKKTFTKMSVIGTHPNDFRAPKISKSGQIYRTPYEYLDRQYKKARGESGNMSKDWVRQFASPEGALHLKELTHSAQQLLGKWEGPEMPKQKRLGVTYKSSGFRLPYELSHTSGHIFKTPAIQSTVRQLQNKLKLGTDIDAEKHTIEEYISTELNGQPRETKIATKFLNDAFEYSKMNESRQQENYLQMQGDRLKSLDIQPNKLNPSRISEFNPREHATPDLSAPLTVPRKMSNFAEHFANLEKHATELQYAYRTENHPLAIAAQKRHAAELQRITKAEGFKPDTYNNSPEYVNLNKQTLEGELGQTRLDHAALSSQMSQWIRHKSESKNPRIPTDIMDAHPNAQLTFRNPSKPIKPPVIKFNPPGENKFWETTRQHIDSVDQAYRSNNLDIGSRLSTLKNHVASLKQTEGAKHVDFVNVDKYIQQMEGAASKQRLGNVPNKSATTGKSSQDSAYGMPLKNISAGTSARGMYASALKPPASAKSAMATRYPSGYPSALPSGKASAAQTAAPSAAQSRVASRAPSRAPSPRPDQTITPRPDWYAPQNWQGRPTEAWGPTEARNTLHAEARSEGNLPQNWQGYQPAATYLPEKKYQLAAAYGPEAKQTLQAQANPYVTEKNRLEAGMSSLPPYPATPKIVKDYSQPITRLKNSPGYRKISSTADTIPANKRLVNYVDTIANPNANTEDWLKSYIHLKKSYKKGIGDQETQTFKREVLRLGNAEYAAIKGAQDLGKRYTKLKNTLKLTLSNKDDTPFRTTKGKSVYPNRSAFLTKQLNKATTALKVSPTSKYFEMDAPQAHKDAFGALHALGSSHASALQTVGPKPDYLTPISRHSTAATSASITQPPSAAQTAMPSAVQTAMPSAVQTAQPSATQTALPSAQPSATQTALPSAQPSAQGSPLPSPRGFDQQSVNAAIPIVHPDNAPAINPNQPQISPFNPSTMPDLGAVPRLNTKFNIKYKPLGGDIPSGTLEEKDLANIQRRLQLAQAQSQLSNITPPQISPFQVHQAPQQKPPGSIGNIPPAGFNPFAEPDAQPITQPGAQPIIQPAAQHVGPDAATQQAIQQMYETEFPRGNATQVNGWEKNNSSKWYERQFGNQTYKPWSGSPSSTMSNTPVTLRGPYAQRFAGASKIPLYAPVPFGTTANPESVTNYPWRPGAAAYGPNEAAKKQTYLDAERRFGNAIPPTPQSIHELIKDAQQEFSNIGDYTKLHDTINSIGDDERLSVPMREYLLDYRDRMGKLYDDDMYKQQALKYYQKLGAPMETAFKYNPSIPRAIFYRSPKTRVDPTDLSPMPRTIPKLYNDPLDYLEHRINKTEGAFGDINSPKSIMGIGAENQPWINELELQQARARQFLASKRPTQPVIGGGGPGPGAGGPGPGPGGPGAGGGGGPTGGGMTPFGGPTPAGGGTTPFGGPAPAGGGTGTGMQPPITPFSTGAPSSSAPSFSGPKPTPNWGYMPKWGGSMQPPTAWSLNNSPIGSNPFTEPAPDLNPPKPTQSFGGMRAPDPSAKPPGHVKVSFPFYPSMVGPLQGRQQYIQTPGAPDTRDPYEKVYDNVFDINKAYNEGRPNVVSDLLKEHNTLRDQATNKLNGLDPGEGADIYRQHNMTTINTFARGAQNWLLDQPGYDGTPMPPQGFTSPFSNPTGTQQQPQTQPNQQSQMQFSAPINPQQSQADWLQRRQQEWDNEQAAQKHIDTPFGKLSSGFPGGRNLFTRTQTYADLAHPSTTRDMYRNLVKVEDGYTNNDPQAVQRALEQHPALMAKARADLGDSDVNKRWGFSPSEATDFRDNMLPQYDAYADGAKNWLSTQGINMQAPQQAGPTMLEWPDSGDDIRNAPPEFKRDWKPDARAHDLTSQMYANLHRLNNTQKSGNVQAMNSLLGTGDMLFRQAANAQDLNEADKRWVENHRAWFDKAKAWHIQNGGKEIYVETPEEEQARIAKARAGNYKIQYGKTQNKDVGLTPQELAHLQAKAAQAKQALIPKKWGSVRHTPQEIQDKQDEAQIYIGSNHQPMLGKQINWENWDHDDFDFGELPGAVYAPNSPEFNRPYVMDFKELAKDKKYINHPMLNLHKHATALKSAMEGPGGPNDDAARQSYQNYHNERSRYLNSISTASNMNQNYPFASDKQSFKGFNNRVLPYYDNYMNNAYQYFQNTKNADNLTDNSLFEGAMRQINGFNSPNSIYGGPVSGVAYGGQIRRFADGGQMQRIPMNTFIPRYGFGGFNPLYYGINPALAFGGLIPSYVNGDFLSGMPGVDIQDQTTQWLMDQTKPHQPVVTNTHTNNNNNHVVTTKKGKKPIVTGTKHDENKTIIQKAINGEDKKLETTQATGNDKKLETTPTTTTSPTPAEALIQAITDNQQGVDVKPTTTDLNTTPLVDEILKNTVVGSDPNATKKAVEGSPKAAKAADLDEYQKLRLALEKEMFDEKTKIEKRKTLAENTTTGTKALASLLAGAFSKPHSADIPDEIGQYIRPHLNPARDLMLKKMADAAPNMDTTMAEIDANTAAMLRESAKLQDPSARAALRAQALMSRNAAIIEAQKAGDAQRSQTSEKFGALLGQVGAQDANAMADAERYNTDEKRRVHTAEREKTMMLNKMKKEWMSEMLNNASTAIGSGMSAYLQLHDGKNAKDPNEKQIRHVEKESRLSKFKKWLSDKGHQLLSRHNEMPPYNIDENGNMIMTPEQGNDPFFQNLKWASRRWGGYVNRY